MIIQHVILDIFHWEAIFVSDIKTKRDLIEVKSLIRSLDIDKEYIKEVENVILENRINGGITFTNTLVKKHVVVLYKASSIERAISTLTHEIRHVVDDICKHLSIEDAETPAYITGYISSVTFTKHIKQ